MPRHNDDPLRCHSPGTLARVLLPWGCALGVFAVEPPDLRLLASIPRGAVKRARLCKSGCHVVVLQDNPQRVRVFTIAADGEPEELKQPQLPAGQIDDLLMVDGAIYAGGVVGGAPMVWGFHSVHASEPGGGTVDLSRWSQLPMPELGGPGGKAVDLLFWRDGDLIAVDDIVFPRWNIVFDVRDPFQPEHVATVQLPAHNSYEQVHMGALGTRYLALYSSGINRGNHSFHLSILCAESQRERACYHAWCREYDTMALLRGKVQPPDPPAPGALAFVRVMTFAGDVLFVLSGDDTLLCYDLRGDPLPRPRGASRRSMFNDAPRGPEANVVALQRIRVIHHIAAPDQRGVAVAGEDAAGEACVEWVGV